MRTSRSFRNISLLIVGFVIGALMMSPVGAHVGSQVQHLWDHIRPLVKDDFYTQAQSNARFVRKSSVRKGFFSCPSTGWYPDQSDNTYWTSSKKRYSTTSPLSVFYCTATLPHGARVRSLRFSLYDAVTPDYVTCTLVRTHLVTHEEADMGGVISGDSPGDTVKTTTTIVHPVIDNKRFGYTLRCALFGSNDDIGFYGASVGYTMTAAKGAAN